VPGWESGPAAGPSWQNAAGTGTAAGTAAGSGYWSGTGQQPAAYDEPPSGDFRSVTGQRRTATAPADRSEQAKPARRRRGPRLVVVIMSLLLAAGLTAAGVWWFTFRGDPGVEPAAYAQSVCTGVRDWQRDVDGQTVALRAKIAPLTDRTAVRAAVVAYYTSLAARTDDLQGALTGAGVPHATGGTDYSQDLIRAVTDQATALRDSATRAGRLDVSSESLFQISLNSLLTNANAAVQKVSDALAHPALGIPPELTTAMQADPTCAAYTG
jgi:Tfp pilus assembly protein PilX